MYKFPNEVLAKILGHLNYDQLMLTKSVGKQFDEVVNYLVGKKIVFVRDYNHPQAVLKMIQTNEYFDEHCWLICESSFIFRNNPDILTSIKRLFLNDLDLILPYVNYENLEVLQIDNKKEQTLKESKIVLKAKNVKFVCILLSNKFPNAEITFSTPRLSDLFIDFNVNQIKFFYHESVRNLYCLETVRSIADFKNLRKLECYHFNLNSVFRLFKRLVHLKEFVFYESSLETSELVDAFNSLNHLKDFSMFYRCFNLKAHSNDLSTAIDDLRSTYLSELNDNTLAVYKRFLNSMGAFKNPIYQINVRNLDDIPFELLHNLENINEFKINDVDFNERKMRMISKLNPLVLNFKTPLKQSLLDQLPNTFKYLVDLKISFDFENLNFVLNFKYLCKLTCDKFFDFNLFKSLARKPNLLKLIEIKSNYAIRFYEDKVHCLLNNRIVFNEKWSTFKCTINMMNDWPDLFGSI